MCYNAKTALNLCMASARVNNPWTLHVVLRTQIECEVGHMASSAAFSLCEKKALLWSWWFLALEWMIQGRWDNPAPFQGLIFVCFLSLLFFKSLLCTKGQLVMSLISPLTNSEPPEWLWSSHLVKMKGITKENISQSLTLIYKAQNLTIDSKQEWFRSQLHQLLSTIAKRY